MGIIRKKTYDVLVKTKHSFVVVKNNGNPTASLVTGYIDIGGEND